MYLTVITSGATGGDESFGELVVFSDIIVEKQSGLLQRVLKGVKLVGKWICFFFHIYIYEIYRLRRGVNSVRAPYFMVDSGYRSFLRFGVMR